VAVPRFAAIAMLTTYRRIGNFVKSDPVRTKVGGVWMMPNGVRPGPTRRFNRRPGSRADARFPYDPAKMAQPTVYDVLDAIDKIANGRPQKYATRDEIADYLGADPDDISDEREQTLLLGKAVEFGFIEVGFFKPRGHWRLTTTGQWVLGQ
jgi:hypothetical protein